MATLTIPNSFINGTAAVATEVNANFTAVKTFAEGIAAGTNIMMVLLHIPSWMRMLRLSWRLVTLPLSCWVHRCFPDD